MNKNSEMNCPDRIKSYFRNETTTLLIVTVTGIVYNVGMTAGPWFEGRLAQALCDIINKTGTLKSMVVLACIYIGVIAFVQLMRYEKRFYVRRFANNVSRNMKRVLYSNLVHKSKSETESENTGALITKAISDVETCTEGMRKFTTEIFDTGVVMAAYLVMLFLYDWRLTLLSCIFPPFAYLAADRLKKVVSRYASEYKQSSERLNDQTLDRVSGGLTYRVLGQEGYMDGVYEERLRDYEKRAAYAGILETAMQPLYQIISMAGVIFIVYFGSRNILGNGWTSWDIAAFTTFLSCFTKLAVKSSKAAKLFNSVQKAKVSWKRIKPLMHKVDPDKDIDIQKPRDLVVSHLSVPDAEGNRMLSDISFSAEPGQIIGITGEVACGKSMLGKTFLCERPYEGSILFGQTELSDMTDQMRCGTVVYSGHDTELISDTISENILLGNKGDVKRYLEAVCMDDEVSQMPDDIYTEVGTGGLRLSGGQQQRIALARTLCNKKPVIILDDPFSALDRNTEKQIMKNLHEMTKDSIVLLISHRLCEFPCMDKVIWIENGRAAVNTHAELMNTVSGYRSVYNIQMGDVDNEK